MLFAFEKNNDVRASLILIWAITLAAVFLQAGVGLMQALIPMKMDLIGFSSQSISYVVSIYGAGFTLGCLFAPRFICNVGHIRAFSSLAATLSILVLLFPSATSLFHWMLIRGIMGFVMAGLFIVSDGWISGSVSNSHRGRILALYTICAKIALMMSPLLVTPDSLPGPWLFMVTSMFFSLSLIPVAGTRSVEPARPATANLNIKWLYSIAPSSVVGCFGVGLMSAPVANMASLYGLKIGLPANIAAQLLFALQAGSLFFQWPTGWISDRIDRRYVIIGVCFNAILACTFVLFASLWKASPTIIIFGFVAWGGTALCLYSLCVAHACDMVPSEQIIPAVSGLLMIWAFGSAIGPLPAGYLMSLIGPHGMFYWSGGVLVIIIFFLTWRVAVMKRSPTPGGFNAIQPLTVLTGTLTDETLIDFEKSCCKEPDLLDLIQQAEERELQEHNETSPSSDNVKKKIDESSNNGINR